MGHHKKVENCSSKKGEINLYFRTEPDGRSCLAMNGNSCPWHRGKVIGGSSTINGMLYVRGSREDFDEWHRLGNPGKKNDKIITKEILSQFHQHFTNIFFQWFSTLKVRRPTKDLKKTFWQATITEHHSKLD